MYAGKAFTPCYAFWLQNIEIFETAGRLRYRAINLLGPAAGVTACGGIIIMNNDNNDGLSAIET